jgi:haloalkane dehalogenase
MRFAQNLRAPLAALALAVSLTAPSTWAQHPTDVSSSEENYARADFPYVSRYVEVDGSLMHYVDTGGDGSTVLMIHGQPTWSYLWRNVIPHLEDNHRVIALDLIGFGKSDQPDIAYSSSDHANYLAGFIDALELDDITLVVHDWGSILGFDYAATHPERVKAIAFMEAAIAIPPAEDPYLPPLPINGESPEYDMNQFYGLLQQIRQPGVGEVMILEQNMFLEGLVLPNFAGLLTEDEMNAYREPFAEGRSRLPMLQFPRSVPIDGETPADSVEMMTRYNDYLRTQENLPKLLLHLSDGYLINRWDVEWMRRNFNDLTIHNMGPGGHFMQEYNPRGIGISINNWMSENGL